MHIERICINDCLAKRALEKSSKNEKIRLLRSWGRSARCCGVNSTSVPFHRLFAKSFNTWILKNKIQFTQITNIAGFIQSTTSDKPSWTFMEQHECHYDGRRDKVQEDKEHLPITRKVSNQCNHHVGYVLHKTCHWNHSKSAHVFPWFNKFKANWLLVYSITNVSDSTSRMP